MAPKKTQDAALEQAFIAGTLPDEDRRAPEVLPVVAAPDVAPELVAATLTVLGRRGGGAEQEVREVLTAAGAARALLDASPMQFAHERVIAPDGTHEYFTATGEKIDPANVVLPSGALARVDA